jgi:hypothetical protein
MYHDTIKINITNTHLFDDVSFNYDFLISKRKSNNFSPITYNDLLNKFKDIGFNTEYVKFNDIEGTEIVYCSYNYQPNFLIFFKAYKKILKDKSFNLNIESGNIINGKFYRNNMNYQCGLYFKDYIYSQNYTFKFYDIIKDKIFVKVSEFYQIVDKNGNIISVDKVTEKNNFESNFFERYEVKLAQRKYKLNRLKKLF